MKISMSNFEVSWNFHLRLLIYERAVPKEISIAIKLHFHKKQDTSHFLSPIKSNEIPCLVFIVIGFSFVSIGYIQYLTGFLPYIRILVIMTKGK